MTEPEHLLFAAWNRLQLVVADLPEADKLLFDYIKVLSPLLAWCGPLGLPVAGTLFGVSLTQDLLQHSVENRVWHAELERRKGELPPRLCNTLHRYEQAKTAEKHALHDLLSQMAEHAEDLRARRALAAKTAMLTGRRA